MIDILVFFFNLSTDIFLLFVRYLLYASLCIRFCHNFLSIRIYLNYLGIVFFYSMATLKVQPVGNHVAVYVSHVFCPEDAFQVSKS